MYNQAIPLLKIKIGKPYRRLSPLLRFLTNLISGDDLRGPPQSASQAGQEGQEPERKRRPGRPRGSKNRKPRGGSSRQEGAFYYQGQLQPSTGPPHLSDINPQNQQYHEFQWRVLNLCAEFYGAAEELVVSRLSCIR